ncbi:aminoacyl-histidine dipeptidase [Clostridium sp. MD294]|uniref:aminoacyl-histidine dipeptidase n=1 Tax=Clostridium sp. MD294 TaxID=97138 RepID=UPI0002CC4183|nr:aminoacyl-histidine dipeptidase [Clostridium sp. MD294]USF29716.1 Cytosol non-specific dipeptidase [Clostridium sp. MD294]
MLEQLEPKSVFQFFEEICNIPHGSKNEKKISDYIVHFAEKRGLYCKQDKANNVLVKKAATKGYETQPTIILQSHIDMVCEKNGNVSHDFETDGLKLSIEQGKIKAKDTTLGADNGIGVAYMLAVLDAQYIDHPALEAVFTTEEEIGMGGAKVFDVSKLEGKVFINLDSEEEGEFVIGCCGGNKTDVLLPVIWEDTLQNSVPYLLKITGLKGGHSGSDIHLQRANANKLIGRILFEIFNVYDISVASVMGGEKDNAITREAEAVLLLKEEQVQQIKENINYFNEICVKEYKEIEDNIVFSLLPMKENVGQCFSKQTTEKIIAILVLLPYGVETMDLYHNNLVESSSNIGTVKTEKECVVFCNAIRSSVESRKELILQKIKMIAKLTEAEINVKGEYPEWPIKRNSDIEKICKQIYYTMYGKQAEIKAIHAGLECGIFSKRMGEEIDMISFGPNISGAHSPDEEVDIASVKRVWEFLLAVIGYKM